MTRKIKGIIPVVHFSFKALILRAQSARKMSALSPFLGLCPRHSQKGGLLLIGRSLSASEQTLGCDAIADCSEKIALIKLNSLKQNTDSRIIVSSRSVVILGGE
jgi:hypothetical protein